MVGGLKRKHPLETEKVEEAEEPSAAILAGSSFCCWKMYRQSKVRACKLEQVCYK